MPEDNRCPQCSKPLPSGSPQGLCPACLLKCGLQPNTVGYTDDAQARTRWTPPAVEQLAPLFPELEILELIGRGGMGAVYKARQKELDRLVALKILPPEIGPDGFAERFAREAQAMARLSHPNIVTIHDFGSRGGTGFGACETAAQPGKAVPPVYFFIMEYVDGLSLRQLLDAGTVSPKEALAIVPQICDALQYAHDRGIVHRDIKPENILLNRAGQVKIADFGLAKLVGIPLPLGEGGPSGPGEGGVTQAGEKVCGTPQYMAPEQMDRPGEVDHRADIYSLGVVFYQMLTGELPTGRFEPPSHKVLIDVRLDEVVLRALEREPSRRYQQVSQVKTEVETIVATSGPAPAAPAQPAAPAPAGVHPAVYGWEYRSKRTLWGLPLVHITDGLDPATGKVREARGIIAFGGKATGLIAIGGRATGVIAFGGLAVGVIAFGGLAVGVIAFGGLVAALLIGYGGAVLAPWAVGGFAAGYYADGGVNVGVHKIDPRWVLHSSVLFYALFIALLLSMIPLAAIARRHRPRWPGDPTARAGGTAATASAPPAPRLSRLAIVGAAWAPFAFIAFVLSFVGHTVVPAGQYHGPEWWQWVLMFTVLPLGLTAPFGTTICGAVSISKIRHSAGRLYGLGLAFFDTLLFPLLALDALIAWGMMNLSHLLFNPFGGGEWAPGEYMAAKQAWYALIALVCLLVDFLIVFWAWRAAKRPPTNAAALPPSSGGAPAPVTQPTEHARQAVTAPAIGLIVAARGGRRVINWAGVVLASVITAALISVGELLFDLVLYRLTGVSIMGWPFAAIAVGGTIIVIGTGIRQAYKLPIERLKSLETGPGPVEATPQLEHARQAVKAPAIGLIVAAGINLLVVMALAAAVILPTLAGPDAPDAVTVNSYFGDDGIEPFVDEAARAQALAVEAAITTQRAGQGAATEASPRGSTRSVAPVAVRGGGGMRVNLLLAVAGLMALPFCLICLPGAIRMMQLRSRGLALTGSILSLLPSPGWLIGLPMGIWALVVLSRREVIDAFTTVRAERARPRSRAWVWMLAATLAALALLAALVMGRHPPYQAQAFLSVTPPADSPLPPIQGIRAAQEEARQLLLASEVLRQAADSIRDTAWYQERSANGADVVQELRRAIQVKPVPETDLVSVSMTGSDPVEVARIVNAVTHATAASNPRVKVKTEASVPRRPVR